MCLCVCCTVSYMFTTVHTFSDTVDNHSHWILVISRFQVWGNILAIQVITLDLSNVCNVCHNPANLVFTLWTHFDNLLWKSVSYKAKQIAMSERAEKQRTELLSRGKTIRLSLCACAAGLSVTLSVPGQRANSLHPDCQVFYNSHDYLHDLQYTTRTLSVNHFRDSWGPTKASNICWLKGKVLYQKRF